MENDLKIDPLNIMKLDKSNDTTISIKRHNSNNNLANY